LAVTARRVHAPRIDFTPLRRELGLPDGFPPAAQQAADAAAARPVVPATDRTDRTELPFVTIDPPGSQDLDQAVHLATRPGGGYRVSYAIADVAAFVEPGDPLDVETQRRGQTIYLPDGKVPLHPAVLSEGAASLLPGKTRPAVLWTIDLDADGASTATRLERALVRSRAQLTYDQVQRDRPVDLLVQVGQLLQRRAAARGAIDLPLPEQEIEPDGAGGWKLTLRAPLPVEAYNAQVSLLTGMAAAEIMLAGGIGLLRTMPPAPPQAFTRLRAAASALGIEWPTDEPVGVLLARLNPAEPAAAAFVEQAADLLRGAAYTSFTDGAPVMREHAAVAAPYAHVTAPLRRLADRYATEICLALHDGRPVPDAIRHALDGLPATMARTDHTAHAAERGAVDLVEAVLLDGREGQEFEAAVLDVDGNRGTVALTDPPVRARCDGRLRLGTRTKVRLVEADPATRKVLFAAMED
jgi:exoribonuclease R